MPSPAQERACEACPVSLAWPQAWAPLAMGPTAARQHGRWPASPPPAMPSHAVTVNRKKKVPGQRGPTDGNGISIEPWWRSPRCNFLSTLRILFQCFRSLLQFLGRVPPAGISMRPWWRSPRWHDATPLLPCARWCSGGTANAIPADIVAASVSDLRGCAASAVTDPGGCRPAGSAPASTTALGGYTAGVSVPPPPPAAEG
ncbi:uncharacterized protein [Zea mays]|uniref:Uncharacterized protein n=1 Tax=Zea mays TaxID=4577 RepID=C0HH62_MAIZE|nr:uncharacterized protein LOC100381574 isoform X2 [Zea mays]ACN26365.1 unknown [Zea mays]|eukprot:XP_020398990.1 uncharacterized protein LOC100381574 isoform X1 [Zea mays]